MSIDLQKNKPRIISLIASSTELVYALGMGDFLVGRSHECDFPAHVKSLPQCTSPKFLTDGSSYEIDQRIRAIVQESLSVYKVDAELLESLKPSHIITQTQCEVCAVSMRDLEDASCELLSSKPEIISLAPDCLEDFFQEVKMVSNRLGVEDNGRRLLDEMKRRISKVSQENSTLVRNIARPRTIACIEWIEPLMAAGNWMPELIELAGGVNLFGEAGKHSPWMSWQDLCRADPDLILVCPCGFDLERTLAEMHLIANLPGYESLKARNENRIFVADGNQYFNRPGPRLVDSLEILSEIIYPESHSDNGPRYQGSGWINYTLL